MNTLRPGGCQGPAQGVEDRRLGPLQQDGVMKAFQAANTHSWGCLDMLGLEGPPQPQSQGWARHWPLNSVSLAPVLPGTD